MAQPPNKKLFSFELRQQELRAKAFGAETAARPAVLENGGAQERHRELMDAIAALRREVAEVHEVKNSIVDVESYKKEVHQAEALKHELEALSKAIEETKKEIAALGHPSHETDRILAVTHELDAVVGATENATETILSAAERVDDIAHSLRMHATAEDDAAALDDIIEQMIKIFEACNFQDITGQRITKVVNTLKLIENRVHNMMDIWGGMREFAKMPVYQEVHDDADKALLNGPQLDHKKISQSDIDKLFG